MSDNEPGMQIGDADGVSSGPEEDVKTDSDAGGTTPDTDTKSETKAAKKKTKRFFSRSTAMAAPSAGTPPGIVSIVLFL